MQNRTEVSKINVLLPEYPPDYTNAEITIHPTQMTNTFQIPTIFQIYAWDRTAL